MSDLEDENDYIASESSEEDDLEMQLNAQRMKNENYLVINGIAVKFQGSDQYKRHTGQYGQISALNQVITWPSDNEKRIIELHFKENGFPNIIGASDGSHTKIDTPESDPDSYINRKEHPVLHNISINEEFVLNDDIELLNEVLPAQDVDLEGEDEDDDRDARRIGDDIVNNLTM
ncbi:hypothetical protein NQ314_016942 [Rhamnusium bicolor]|uniref:Uncharacterized protein n=1 Tax=Rhamnusium bicolor TaxID=1586634 RepID=A0AAV8WVY4_9CUCU|nr:hypothetical protein NQ314_016942 [Rhamnusium bicolor]